MVWKLFQWKNLIFPPLLQDEDESVIFTWRYTLKLVRGEWACRQLEELCGESLYSACLANLTALAAHIFNEHLSTDAIKKKKRVVMGPLHCISWKLIEVQLIGSAGRLLILTLVFIYFSTWFPNNGWIKGAYQRSLHPWAVGLSHVIWYGYIYDINYVRKHIGKRSFTGNVMFLYLPLHFEQICEVQWLHGSVPVARK